MHQTSHPINNQTRLLLAALLLAAPLQLAADACLLSYAKDAEAEAKADEVIDLLLLILFDICGQFFICCHILMFDVCGSCQAIKSKSNAASLPKQASDSSYSPLLGAYVILGLMAAACATAATVLLTYLALMDRRCVPPSLFWAFFHHAKRAYPQPTTHTYTYTHSGLRWGAGLGLGALSFLLLAIAVAYPGLSRHRGGFLVAWLPYVLGACVRGGDRTSLMAVVPLCLLTYGYMYTIP